jgi:hypothetical protein
MRSRRAKLTYALIVGCLCIVLMSGLDTSSKWGPGVIVPQVRDSFTSGSNVGYTFGRYLYRKFGSGRTDRDFDQRAFITQYEIPYHQRSWFMGTTNEQEALWLLADVADTEYKHRLIAARGEYSANLAWWIASGLAPLAVLLAFLAIRRYGLSTARTEARR